MNGKEPVVVEGILQKTVAVKLTSPTVLDVYESVIIVAALGSLTVGLVSGRLSEQAFAALMGAFMGYTFGRIFNHFQAKE
jgi:hypothetical protein